MSIFSASRYTQRRMEALRECQHLPCVTSLGAPSCLVQGSRAAVFSTNRVAQWDSVFQSPWQRARRSSFSLLQPIAANVATLELYPSSTALSSQQYSRRITPDAITPSLLHGRLTFLGTFNPTSKGQFQECFQINTRALCRP